jgi:hypothetical protein
MDNENIEDIVPEYKNKPYKFISDLPSYFGDIMLETNTWTFLPFKVDDRFIDFSRGLRESGMMPVEFESSKHLSKDYTGFVNMNNEKNKFPLFPQFIPNSAYIVEGEFRYAQEDFQNEDVFSGKSQVFMKNGTILEIIANQFEEDDTSESTIGNIARIANKELAEKDYFATVIQYPGTINININRKDLTPPGSMESRLNPFLGLVFSNEYIDVLDDLRNDQGMFNNIYSLGCRFGEKKVIAHSTFYDKLETKLNTEANNRNSLVLNDALDMLNYLYR